MRDAAGESEFLHEGVDDVDVVELVLFLKPVLPDHGDAVLDVGGAVIDVRVGRRVEMVAELLYQEILDSRDVPPLLDGDILVVKAEEQVRRR